ncbi:MAG TPA: hypothetical protein VGF32_01765 [Streptosporangiaceae bacterium]|jgi:hypothetical protein
MSDIEELRALVREVIRDVLPSGLPGGLPVTETVNLSTDEDLAAFVKRLLDLDPGQCEELRSGRKRFRLALSVPAGAPQGAERAGESTPVRRIERGAVTEAVINQAARAGQRLVLGRAAVLTPLARDRARASGVQIEKER